MIDEQPAHDGRPSRRPRDELEAPPSGRRGARPPGAVGLARGKAKFVGRPIRAEGNLVHGSLEKREQPCEYRFTITKNGASLPVRFAQCVVPATFRDVPGLALGSTVEGELQPDNGFEATSVLAKCPSKYDMQQRKQRGEEMP